MTDDRWKCLLELIKFLTQNTLINEANLHIELLNSLSPEPQEL